VSVIAGPWRLRVRPAFEGCQHLGDPALLLRSEYG